MKTIDTKQLLKDIDKVITSILTDKDKEALNLLWEMKENLSKVNDSAD